MSTNQNPERSTGFLLRDNSRLMKTAFNDRVSGLTQAQWGALAHLSRNQGLNQVGLADLLEVQPITVARLIDKLVALSINAITNNTDKPVMVSCEAFCEKLTR